MQGSDGKRIVGYDPKTGKPIYGDGQQSEPAAQPPETQADTEAAQPAGPEQAAAGEVPPPQPVYGAGSRRSDIPPRKNKAKKFLPLIIIGAAAAVIGIVLYALPQLTLAFALNNTAKDADKIFSRYDEATGYDTVAKPLLESDSTVDLNARVYGGELGIPDGMGVDLKVNTSMEQKKTSLDLDVLGGGGLNMLQASLYADEEHLQLGLPQLYDGMLRVEAENIIGQYNSSVFAAEFGESDMEDFSLNLFASDERALSPEHIRAAYLDYAGELLKAEAKNISVERGRRATREAFGGSRGCSAYVVAIPRDTVRSIVRSVKGFAQEDDALREYLCAALSPVADMRGLDVDALLDEVFEDIENRLAEDMLLTFYVAKNRVVGMDVDWGIDGAAEDMQVSVELAGVKNPWEEYSIGYSSRLNLGASKIPVQLTITGTEKTQDDALSSGLAIDAMGGPSLRFARGYNTTNGEYTLSGSFRFNEMDYAAAVEGTMGVNNNRFVTTVDGMLLDTGDGGKPLGVNVEYVVSPLTREIAPQDNTPIDLFKMDEAEMQGFTGEIALNLFNNLILNANLPFDLSALGGLLGGMGDGGLLGGLPGAADEPAEEPVETEEPADIQPESSPAPTPTAEPTAEPEESAQAERSEDPTGGTSLEDILGSLPIEDILKQLPIEDLLEGIDLRGLLENFDLSGLQGG